MALANFDSLPACMGKSAATKGAKKLKGSAADESHEGEAGTLPSIVSTAVALSEKAPAVSVPASASTLEELAPSTSLLVQAREAKAAKEAAAKAAAKAARRAERSRQSKMAKGVEPATQVSVDVAPPKSKKVDRSLKDTPPSSPKGVVLSPSPSRPLKVSSKSPSDVVGKAVMMISADKRPPSAAVGTPVTKQVVTQTAQTGGHFSGTAGASLIGASTRELAWTRAEGMYCTFNFFIFFAFPFAH